MKFVDVALLAVLLTASLSSPATSGLTPCDGASLRVSASDRVGALGHDGVNLILHNKGTQACTMRGYVRIQAEVNGKPLKLHITHSGGMLINPGQHNLPPVQTVTLQPGRDAYVAIEWHEAGGDPCPTITKLHITPPGGRTAATVATGSFLYVCEGVMDMTPVAPRLLLKYG